MKKILIALFLSTMIVGAINAQTQNYSYEYGKVSTYELTMKEYDKDKDAEAVVLYEEGKNYFSGNYDNGRFELYMEYRVKIKVLTQAGIKYGDFEIPYYIEDRDFERVENIEGATYNLEDYQVKKTELDLKNVFEEKIGKNTRVKKIAMPNVREGSVIELKYRIVTPFFFYMREWQFQKKIPVVYSKLYYKAIPYYEYTYIMKGATKFDEFASEVINEEIRFYSLLYREVKYTFGMRNLPAFRDEEFISSPNDYMVSLNFQVSTQYFPQGGSKQIMSTWPQICDELLDNKNFGKYIKNSEKEGKKILATMDIANKSDLDKIKRITQYVKQNYNWDGFTSKYTTDKVDAFLKQKTGNSADINLFLVGLLRASGVQATPIVLSTRSNGAVSIAHPFSKFLNYVIVQASTADTTYLIDATVSALDFDELPERCTNVLGLEVKPKSDKWIDITQNNLALTEKEFNIKLNESKEALLVDAKTTSYSYDAYKYRSIYQDKEDKLLDYLRLSEIEPTEGIAVENYNEVEKPFVFSYKYTSAIEQSMDNKLFIAPFLNQSVTDNIFKQIKRKLPVDLIYCRGGQFISTIEIPDGYRVEYLPSPLNYNGRLITINYSTSVVDNKIKVIAGYTFKQSIYNAIDYGLLKGYYGEIVKKFNEMIILVKDSK